MLVGMALSTVGWSVGFSGLWTEAVAVVGRPNLEDLDAGLWTRDVCPSSQCSHGGLSQ